MKCDVSRGFDTRSMTRVAAKELERAQLDAMIERLPVDGVATIEDGESPDFTLTFTNGRRVGVEAVRALNPSVASGAGVRARLRNKIVAELKKRGVPALVGLSIPTSLLGALNKRPDLVRGNIERIIDLACKEIPADAGHWEEFGTDYSSDPGSLESVGIHWMRRVSIARSSDSEPEVLITSSGDMESPSLVQDAIACKNELLPDYRTDVDEQWLLVVGSERTGGSLYTDQVEGLRFVSAFERTIFLELFEGRCIELATDPVSM